MAGVLAWVLFLAYTVIGRGFEINQHECKASGTIMYCNWKGRGNYVVSSLMQHEILIFDYLTDEATVIVPQKFLGTLRKIEVKRGDVKCSAIDTPPDVQVYIKDRDCVSTIDVFFKYRGGGADHNAQWWEVAYPYLLYKCV